MPFAAPSICSSPLSPHQDLGQPLNCYRWRKEQGGARRTSVLGCSGKKNECMCRLSSYYHTLSFFLPNNTFTQLDSWGRGRKRTITWLLKSGVTSKASLYPLLLIPYAIFSFPPFETQIKTSVLGGDSFSPILTTQTNNNYLRDEVMEEGAGSRVNKRL